jgi:glycosyl transferase, family 25
MLMDGPFASPEANRSSKRRLIVTRPLWPSAPADAPAGPRQEGGGAGVQSFHPCPPADATCAACGGSNRFDWSFVDAVYCISLRERDDRAAAAAAQFHRVGLCRRVLFYRPLRHPRNSTEGIWESHREVARHALAAGYRTVLIFEDDAIFRPVLTPRKLDRVRRAFRSLPADWTIFYLGHWPLRVRFVSPNVLRTCSACTHAYVASRALLEWLAATPYAGESFSSATIGKGIDAAYARLKGVYAIFPMVAIQSTSPSDHISRGKHKKIRTLRHLVIRTRLHDYLLSYLMRPAELLAVALSPLQRWQDVPTNELR